MSSLYLDKILSLDPIVMLLCDDSDLHLSERQQRLWLAGTTPDKKMTVQSWIPTHQLPLQQWLLTFKEMVVMEFSMARIHRAKVSTWKKAAVDISELLTNGSLHP